MILHLLTDEKFTDYAIKQFSAPEMQSEFVLVPSNNIMEHVKLIDRCTVVRQSSPEYRDLLNRLNQYTGIIFHGLFWGRWQKPILEHISKDVKIAWVFWGGEIYSRHEIKDDFIAPITRVLYRLHICKKNEKHDTSWEIPMALYHRIDYCLTDSYEEFMLGKKYTHASYNHIWYNYYSIEETIGALADKQCSGTNIWLGNSAAEWNNHFDALLAITKTRKQLNDGDCKIIIPLSYGSPWIRNVMLNVGRRIFGKRMQALTDFMPRDNYNALMLSCSTMIINYWEPAAQGNIITGLWLGMRLYLSEHSASYDYFKRIGCKIYSVEKDLNRKNPNVFAPMTQEDIETNRAVLRKWYSKDEMHKRNLEIIKALS